MAIQILDRETVNKIAAGEIIERPASALKELLENSADSGATRIEIDFEEGGKKELRVTDNGEGIAPEELLLALEPHATSKITKIDDLVTLDTFGFRGEALASVSAVSDFTLHSSLKDASSGAKVVSLGGSSGTATPAAPINGTQVVVKNLFYNVPARQKFLKSDAGETAAIKKTVRAFALAHPEITLTLRQGGRVVLHWEKESFLNRARSVLEVEKNQLLHITAEDRHLKLEAAVALPEASLPTQQGLWIFVQGRPVFDRSLQQAVLEGYRNLLMQHQYPKAVISLRVDPAQVDVNVHPTKAQVKFSEPGVIFRFVSHAIRGAFEQHYAPGPTGTSKAVPAGMDQKGTDMRAGGTIAIEAALAMNPEGAARSEQLFGQQSLEGFRGAPQFSEQASLNFVREAVVQYNKRSFTTPTSQDPEVIQSTFVPSMAVPAEAAGTEALDSDLRAWSSMQIIGQAENTYIFCQSFKGVVIIDQHAAHERVLFERIKRQNEEGKIETQGALIEEIIELPRESIETLTDSKWSAVFTRLGFEFVDRGPTSLAIAARPAFLADLGLKPLIERMIEQIEEAGGTAVLDDLVNDIWATMSCHGAIRAGRTLSHAEMHSLLEQMDECPFSSFCPHGRPVSVQWSSRDLEKLFKRIV